VLSAMRYSNMPVSPQIGQMLLVGLAIVELMMVCFVTPAVTAGAISSEREKLTYEMLLATPLRPASILWGKLISALGYVFLLIFAAVPMASLVFTFGGVTLVDMLKVLVILLATAVTLGVAGVFMSVWVGRTVRATVLSYLFVLGLLIGPLIVYIFVGVIVQAMPPRWLLVPNPVSALISGLSSASSYGGPMDFLGGLSMILGGTFGARDGSALAGSQGIPRPLYHYTLPLYGVLSLTLYLLAARLVRPSRRWRIRWREALAAFLLFLALGGAVAVPFVLTADRYERVTVPAKPTPVPFMPPPVLVEKRVVPVLEPTPTLPPTITPSPTPAQAPPTQPASPPPGIGRGPGGGHRPPTVTGTSAFSETDQVAIYAAVVRQLYKVDHMRSEPPGFTTIYLLRTTDDGCDEYQSPADPKVPCAEPVLLSESMQAAVVEALADLGAEIKWVDEDATITLGNVFIQADGSALVSAQFRFSPAGTTGKAYILERIDGFWQVTGDMGL
jgi:ABC-2 type transport system permease protein